LIRDAASFGDALDQGGHATDKFDFELMVGISHLFFDSLLDPLSFLDWTKIGTSEFPTRPPVRGR
jgi:hypothetical protein